MLRLGLMVTAWGGRVLAGRSGASVWVTLDGASARPAGGGSTPKGFDGRTVSAEEGSMRKVSGPCPYPYPIEKLSVSSPNPRSSLRPHLLPSHDRPQPTTLDLPTVSLPHNLALVDLG